MWKSNGKGLFILFSILGLTIFEIDITKACSCALQHPQTHFCKADFVAVIRVKKFINVNDHEAAYKVKIHKIFKATPKAQFALEEHLLWTATSDAACGVTFMKPKETWVVSGGVFDGKPRISLCGLSMRWSDVTPRQRKGFRQFYRHGCVCQISYTPWRNKGAVLESAGGKSCLWESAPGPFDCQEKYGICMLRPSGCSWIPSVSYKQCILNHQRHREQRPKEP